MPPLSKDQAIQKLRHYCTYQERSHAEVKQKLFALKVSPQLHDEIIAALIEADYLNEERFARQFTGGKFRMKGWGRRKIVQKLKEKQVSPYVISAAMKEINEDDYLQELKEEAIKKYQSLKNEQHLVRRKKTMDYLVQKGYEPELIAQALNSIIQNPKT